MSQKTIKRLRREVREKGLGGQVPWRRVKRASRRPGFDLILQAAGLRQADWVSRVRHLTPAQARAALERVRKEAPAEQAAQFELMLEALGKL